MTSPAPDALDRAARTLLESTLALRAGETVAIIGDIATSEILTVLERASRALDADVITLRLDQLLSHASHATNHPGERPHKILPEEVARALGRVNASVFVAAALRGESSMREQLLRLVAARAIRHAHLPDVAPATFAAGLAGQENIAAAGAALARLLEVGREVTSTSPAGTNLVVHPGARPWVARVGTAEPGEPIALPTGSLVVCPESVRGTFVATASLGEFFGARERLLREPVSFEIEDGAVSRVHAAGAKDLVRDIEAMLSVAPNSNRVGLVVLGVNEGCGDAMGIAAVDQHRPGLHLVFGDPQSKLTQATWTARTTFAACQRVSSVQIDGRLVIDGGRLSALA